MSLILDFSENLGGATQLYARGEGEMISNVAAGRPEIRTGEALKVGIEARHIYLFDAAGLAI